MKRGAKFVMGAVAGFVIVTGGFFLSGPGRDIRNLWSHGVIQAVVDQPGADRKYSASRQSNLKSIYVALNLYQDSEGKYPQANGWMDAIKQRLHTNDMSNEEAAKKLVRPNLANPAPDQFGYAINDKVAGKYRGDIKDASTPLVFESADLSKNAHGVPTEAKGSMEVTLDGRLKQF